MRQVVTAEGKLSSKSTDILKLSRGVLNSEDYPQLMNDDNQFWVITFERTNQFKQKKWYMMTVMDNKKNIIYLIVYVCFN